MKERTRPLTGQEWDQAQRVEEMRKQRAEEAATEARAAKAKALGETPAGLAPLDPPATDADNLFDSGPPVPLPRLADQPALPPPAADTEALLNGLIEECRYLLREVAFNSARLTPNADDRIRFLSSAESLAMTGAKIADTIGRLRGGSSEAEHRHRVIYEHASSPPSPRVKSPKNEKQ